MQRLILVYGGIAGTVELILLALSMGLVSNHGGLGMVLGYLSMLIAMSMVFVGVKRFRDEQQGGVIKFGKALLVGLGIAGIACLFYVLGWEAYMWSSDYSFMEKFTASELAKMQTAHASATEIAKFKAEMQGFAEMYADPVSRMLMTLMEISPVALLVPLLSAALLRNPRFMPAKV
ncbi:MAG: DUF4199 domain-containing protein [Novosphingobium sp.]|uniref:DUF4199 domain-containing protein n=1 Tax=Novosphingobium sp. TaxID=1874826 RepID=UPI0032BA5CC9